LISKADKQKSSKKPGLNNLRFKKAADIYKFFTRKGNTVRAIFGDLMMIRTVIDLKKGDEVTVKYLPPMDTYEKRHHVFTKKWGFQCECRLCKLDRQESPELVKERQKWVNKYEEEVK
jgi:hypothetical protein